MPYAERARTLLRAILFDDEFSAVAWNPCAGDRLDAPTKAVTMGTKRRALAKLARSVFILCGRMR